jgi:hypothetical protein
MFENDLTPIAAAMQAGDLVFGKIIGEMAFGAWK